MEVNQDVKPDNHDWCRHATHAKTGASALSPKASCGGCQIYQKRPQECRDFHCMWLLDTRVGEHWYPARSKIVINSSEGPPKTVAFIVDPDYPLRWREEPWFSDIKYMAQAGIDGRLDQKWSTIVMIGEQRIPIITGRAIRSA